MGRRQSYEIMYFRNGLENPENNKVIMSFKQLQRLKKIPWITIVLYKKIGNCIGKEVDLLPI